MQSEFLEEVQLLKRLDGNALYSKFLDIEFDTLRPQWHSHFRNLIANKAHNQVKEIFGPKNPGLPELTYEEMRNEITNAQGNDVLFLNHSLSYVEETSEVLDTAQNAGFKIIVIHDAPRDGTFRHVFKPEVNFFTEQNEVMKTEPSQCCGNPIFENAIRWSESAKWKVAHDGRFDHTYQTDSEKLSLLKMELGYDLVKHRIYGKTSKFNELATELDAWYMQPKSIAMVEGCSRWLVLTKAPGLDAK